MKHLKTFENITNKFKVGDYVYPLPEHTKLKSSFNVLEYKKYKIIRIFTQFGFKWFELEGIDPKHINEFNSDIFMTETDYEANKYNL